VTVQATFTFRGYILKMHSQYLSLVVFSACVLPGIVSIPLSVDYVQPETDWEKLGLKKNAEIIQKAETEANQQIPIMEKVLNDPENKNHEQVIKAAFGAHPNFDLNVVKENVQHLKNGRVLVDLEAETIKDSIGFTSYDKAVPKRNPTFVKFSTNYYKPRPKHLRLEGLTGKALKEAKVENTARLQAGALLHEASHFIKEIDAGDYVDEQRKPSEVLRGTDLKTTDLAIYTKGSVPYRKPADLDADTGDYTKLRSGYTNKGGEETHKPAKNFHLSAESYTQFASLCSNLYPNVRRDLHIYGRALGDLPAVHYLMRRQACALPKAAVAKTNKSAPKSAVEAGKEAMSLTAKHVGSRSKPSGASSEKPSEKSKLSPSVQGPGKSRSAARSKPATKLSSRPSNSRSRESPKAIPASKRLAKAATASRSRAAPRPKALAKKSMSPAPRPTSARIIPRPAGKATRKVAPKPTVKSSSKPLPSKGRTPKTLAGVQPTQKSASKAGSKYVRKPVTHKVSGRPTKPTSSRIVARPAGKATRKPLSSKGSSKALPGKRPTSKSVPKAGLRMVRKPSMQKGLSRPSKPTSARVVPRPVGKIARKNTQKPVVKSSLKPVTSKGRSPKAFPPTASKRPLNNKVPGRPPKSTPARVLPRPAGKAVQKPGAKSSPKAVAQKRKALPPTPGKRPAAKSVPKTAPKLVRKPVTKAMNNKAPSRPPFKPTAARVIPRPVDKFAGKKPVAKSSPKPAPQKGSTLKGLPHAAKSVPKAAPKIVSKPVPKQVISKVVNKPSASKPVTRKGR
jgi:hypothetical protein